MSCWHHTMAFQQIKFTPMMEAVEQYMSYPALTYFAELGGYAGVFLGLSLLQLSDLILYLISWFAKLQNCLKGNA